MEEMANIEINLSAGKNGPLSESFMAQFGWGVENILKQLFGSPGVPVFIKGEPPEIKAFANAIQKEYDYIDIFRRNGLDSNYTYASKNRLNNAIRGFENQSGIKWPFK